MLSVMLVVASVLAGLVKAPWWFWLLSGLTIAIVKATEPERFRMNPAEVRGFASFPLVLEDLKLVTKGCVMSALSFAAGSGLSTLLLG